MFAAQTEKVVLLAFFFQTLTLARLYFYFFELPTNYKGDIQQKNAFQINLVKKYFAICCISELIVDDDYN